MLLLATAHRMDMILAVYYISRGLFMKNGRNGAGDRKVEIIESAETKYMGRIRKLRRFSSTLCVQIGGGQFFNIALTGPPTYVVACLLYQTV